MTGTSIASKEGHYDGVHGLSNPSNVPRNPDGTNNVDPFAATLDPNTTDRLIIQDLQPDRAMSIGWRDSQPALLIYLETIL